MERFRVEVGHANEVKPGNIVGAIANEAGIESRYIGRIQIFDDHSLVDLPEGMPDETFRHLQRVWVSGRRLELSRVSSGGPPRKGGPRGGPNGGPKKGGKPSRAPLPKGAAGKREPRKKPF